MKWSHGHCQGNDGRPTPEYRLWSNIKSRCYNKQLKSYKDYGGRGIRVCDRWLNSFQDFLMDVGMRPSKAHSLDRVKNDGNYEPGNCRWATAVEQAANRRSSLDVAGLTTQQAANITGLHKNTIVTRKRAGWSDEKILATTKEAPRTQKNNRNLTWNGQTRTMSEWCRHANLSVATVATRLRRELPMDQVLRPGRLDGRPPRAGSPKKIFTPPTKSI